MASCILHHSGGKVICHKERRTCVVLFQQQLDGLDQETTSFSLVAENKGHTPVERITIGANKSYLLVH